MIDKEAVKRIADLARLSVPDTELESIAKDLESIVSFVDVVQSRTIEQTDQSLDSVNVFREDAVLPLESKYDLVEAAPVHKDGFVSVPKVIE
jgi:aspartyl-tRNA(Asn)/glutamyl-tRNA(Gln) amidotransferase subunit C